MAEIGENIKRARVRKDMTQYDLAESAGVSQPAISQIETGRNKVSLETLVKLAKALGISPAELL